MTVEFTDASGRTHEFFSPAGGNRQQKVGDTLTVFYDPADPSQAQTRDDRITPPVVGGLAALILASVSWSYFVRAKRAAQSEPREG